MLRWLTTYPNVGAGPWTTNTTCCSMQVSYASHQDPSCMTPSLPRETLGRSALRTETSATLLCKVGQVGCTANNAIGSARSLPVIATRPAVPPLPVHVYTLRKWSLRSDLRRAIEMRLLISASGLGWRIPEPISFISPVPSHWPPLTFARAY